MEKQDGLGKREALERGLSQAAVATKRKSSLEVFEPFSALESAASWDNSRSETGCLPLCLQIECEIIDAAWSRLVFDKCIMWRGTTSIKTAFPFRLAPGWDWAFTPAKALARYYGIAHLWSLPGCWTGFLPLSAPWPAISSAATMATWTSALAATRRPVFDHTGLTTISFFSPTVLASFVTAFGAFGLVFTPHSGHAQCLVERTAGRLVRGGHRSRHVLVLQHGV